MNRSFDSEFCRTRAAEWRDQLDASSLANVREKILRSQKAWEAMAEMAVEREGNVRTAALRS